MRIPLSDATITQLQGWTTDYRHAVRINEPSTLFALGQALFAWLDQSGWATAWAKGMGPRVLEIAVQETDEALRIRREEELPVYERLGDVRSRAVTMGQIADILQGRGETDEALRIHLEDRLPVAIRMQDIDSVAHIRYCCAGIRLARGGLQGDEGQIIIDELAESFTLFR